MSTTRTKVQQMMTDQAVDTALTLTAQMFGLKKATVAMIVQVGLPLVANAAQTNPELLKRLYAVSQSRLPEPIPAFYSRMAETPTIRQAVMDDYKVTFGGMLDMANREAARQAGTTDGQAKEVLAAALPVVTHVLAEANTSGTERGFAQRLRELQA